MPDAQERPVQDNAEGRRIPVPVGPPNRSGHRPYLPVNGKGGSELSGPYQPVLDWPQPVEEGWRLAGGAGVCPESPDRVLVVSHFGIVRERTTPIVWGQEVFWMDGSPFANGSSPLYQNGLIESAKASEKGRPDHHVTVYDRDGKLTESWTWHDHRFGKLNRVFVRPDDPEHHVWITDSVNRRIFEFSSDGKELIMELTAEDAKSTPESPWKGQDMAWLPNGDFYTAGLRRIDRFSREGEHLSSIARPGKGPGEFADLHGLVLDQQRHRIYIADRGNARIQVFDEEWNFIEEWPNILAPYALRLTEDGFIWLGDGYTGTFTKYDLEGKLVCSWGQFGIAPGCTFGTHYFDTDQEGNLYVAEAYGDRVQKYRPRDDIDPHDPRLIGKLVRY